MNVAEMNVADRDVARRNREVLDGSYG